MRRNTEISVRREVHFCQTLYDPIDFVLEPSQLSTLSCPSVPADFEFVIDGRSYKCNKGLVRTVFTNVNDQLNSNPDIEKITLPFNDPKCDFQIIQCMLAGEVITITEENAYFLNCVATTLGNDQLRSTTEIYLSRYKDGELQKAKWHQRLFAPIFGFFSNISMICRIFLFLCELIGFAIGFAFIFNLFMVPLTSGLISPTMPDIFRYGLMLPFFLFFINITTLIEILIFYIVKSNHYRSEIPIPKHIQLIKLIIHVWPFCNRKKEVLFSELELSSAPLVPSNPPINEKVSQNIKRKFFLFTGQHNLYNAILGLLLVILCILFVFTDIFKSVIIFFCVNLPTFLTATVYLLYGIHAILSVFQKSRENFIKYGDFSDPFVCSMYFTESRYHYMLHRISMYLKSKSNMKGHIDENINDDDIYNQNSEGNFIGKKKSRCNFLKFIESESLSAVILRTIFSKATAGILIEIGLILLLIIEHDAFEPAQTASIVLIVLLLLIPIMCSVNFPSLIYQRLFFPRYSESQVKLQDKWMYNKEQRNVWLKTWFTWSKDATSIRTARIIFSVFYVIAIIGSIFPAVIFKQEDLAGSFDNYTSYYHNANSFNKTINNYYQDNITKIVYLKNPVCDLRIDDMNMYQLSALAESSYQPDNDNLTLDMLKVFFGVEWSNTLQMINDTNKTSFTRNYIRHYLYKNRTHIISIRGTANTIDALADVELWASSFIMNILSSSIPIFNGYVSDFRNFLGYAMTLPRYMFKTFSLINSYIEGCQNFIEEIPTDNGTEIVLTGHSLGGGLAKLVSAMLGYKAVSYSGPGIQALTAFYGWKNDNIAQSFTNIIPNLDPVAGVDQATGSSFYIPCQAGMIKCHDIIRTMCMLTTVCNGLNNETWRFCVNNYGEREMNNMIMIGAPYYYSL